MEIDKLLKDYKVGIKSIKSIDNWMWDNEKEIECRKQIEEILDDKCIVIIQNSKNIIVWMINKHIKLNDELADYKVKIWKV